MKRAQISVIWRFEVPGRTVTFSTQFERWILRDSRIKVSTKACADQKGQFV